MDKLRISRLSQVLESTHSRRAAGRLLAGLGFAAAWVPEDGAIARKSKKKKPKKCKNGTKRCGKKCVDLSSNKANCGGCGKRCSATEFCRDGSCNACDVCPDCVYQTVQEVVNDAQGPAEFQLCPGRYAENVIITRELTMRGAGDGPGGSEIHGRNAGPAIAVREGLTVNLTGLRITGGSGCGGGITNMGDLTITACSVLENQGHFECGCIFSQEASRLKLQRSTVINNSHGVVSRGDLQIDNCRIADNADRGIFSEHSATITDTIVEGNVGPDRGGGIYSLGELTLARSTIRGNRATAGDGGGIAFDGNATITDTTIEENIARNNGGGIVASVRDAASLTNCTVRGNHANGEASFAEGGGGIRSSGQGTLTLTGTMVTANETTHQGGGIMNGGALLVLNDSSVTNNLAEDAGGGIYNFGALALEKSTIADNYAEDGGGIANYYDATVTLTESDITNNTANITGGGVFNQSDVTLNDSAITGNHALGGANSGGGIYMDLGSSSLSLHGSSSVTGNDPDDCWGC